MSLRLIISGGGTGGHIFPAIAIANAVKSRRPEADILFVGALGKMEMEKVPAAGFRIVGLNISGLNRSSFFENLTFPFKLLGSLFRSWKILRDFKPNVVVGVGGFASGPVMYVAGLLGIPTVIQEQNSYAGITNRLLGAKAKKVCVAYTGMDRFFPAERLVHTGNPVRQDILNLDGKRELALQTFGLDPTKQTLLVIGGSLGARSINLAVKNHIGQLKESGAQVVWQTGKLFIDQAQSAIEEASASNFFVSDFIYAMDQAYAVADVIISRAGASSISELCIVGKPAVLVPFPHAAEDHQTKNATALVENDAAILVADDQADQQACEHALRLLNNQEERERLGENIRKLALPNADRNIAEEILKLAHAA